MIKRYVFLMIACLMTAVGFFASNAEASAAKKIPPIEREDAFLAEVRKHLLNRDEKFVIVADEKINILFGDDSEYLFDEVFESKTTVSDDFDYLRYNVKSYGFTVDAAEKKAIYHFTVAYYDSLAKAGDVDKRAAQVLQDLKRQNVADGMKAVRIHDYIVKEASIYLGQGKDSAHDALKKSASSRGYALFTYKMMNEAGIPCRIVSGRMGSAAHVWNIIRLDGNWYHVDNSADAAGRTSLVPVKYTYFLAGSKAQRKSHVFDDVYQSVDFENDHPISGEDYAGKGKLILTADAKRVQERSGVGLFNETYGRISDIVVDSVERANDKISDIILDGLGGVFGGI